MPYNLWPFVAFFALVVWPIASRHRVAVWAGVTGAVGLLACALNGAPPFETPASSIGIGPSWAPLMVYYEPHWMAVVVLVVLGAWVVVRFGAAWVAEGLRPFSPALAIGLLLPATFFAVRYSTPGLRHLLGPQDRWLVRCEAADGPPVEGIAEDLAVMQSDGRRFWVLRDAKNPKEFKVVQMQPRSSCTYSRLRTTGARGDATFVSEGW